MGYTSIKIRQDEYPGMTLVPNEFIDRYMGRAPGEYVKVYLYLLRCLNDSEAVFSFARAARLFDSSEGDIRRALYYWEAEALLSLECSGDTITGISLCAADAYPSAGRDADAAGRPLSSLPQEVPAYPVPKLRAFAAQEESAQMIFVIEQYLGRRLTHRDLCCLYCWSEELSFPPDLIIDLADLCVSEGLQDLAQLHGCALEWYGAGLRTSADARAFRKAQQAAADSEAQRQARLQMVCEVMGITGRSLNDTESAQVGKWADEWHFTDEMIREACRRTVANTHQASFEYADTVLRNWHRAHITDPDGVRAADEAYRARKGSAKRRNPDAISAAQEKESSRRGKYGELELLTMANI